jgi:glycosyltransferase involved in cell wall biosynthesis
VLRNRPPLDRALLRLSVLIPVFNERDTIEIIVEQVRSVGITTEIICVDDCSTDGTRGILEELRAAGRVDVLIRQPRNMGKGAAIRAALAASTGDVVVVQDADLEYDPNDWYTLLEPIIDGRADAVFGSRFLGGPHRVLFYWHSVGNSVLTTLSNMFTNLNLTDMETCYKVIRGDVARSLRLTANRFGLEPEITARLAQAGVRIYEMPISYSGRTYAEGKKIGWKDGMAALGHILRYNLWRRGERFNPVAHAQRADSEAPSLLPDVATLESPLFAPRNNGAGDYARDDLFTTQSNPSLVDKHFDRTTLA